MVEPWLRGTLLDVEPVRRQVLHAFELTVDDVERWCAGLSDAEIEARPLGLASIGYHLRHIARSLDRLLTYAEGGVLDAEQRAALQSEMEAGAGRAGVLVEFAEGMERARERVRAIRPESFAEARGVGREQLPVPVAGLLIHCAEHTQRHAGQMVTTAKVVMGIRNVADVR